MNYYTTHNFKTHGISSVELSPALNNKGEIAYYVNLDLNAKYEEEYLNTEDVFKNYDEALKSFIDKVNISIAEHEKNIAALKAIYHLTVEH